MAVSICLHNDTHEAIYRMKVPLHVLKNIVPTKAKFESNARLVKLIKNCASIHYICNCYDFSMYIATCS